MVFILASFGVKDNSFSSFLVFQTCLFNYFISVYSIVCSWFISIYYNKLGVVEGKHHLWKNSLTIVSVTFFFTAISLPTYFHHHITGYVYKQLHSVFIAASASDSTTVILNGSLGPHIWRNGLNQAGNWPVSFCPPVGNRSSVWRTLTMYRWCWWVINVTSRRVPWTRGKHRNWPAAMEFPTLRPQPRHDRYASTHIFSFLPLQMFYWLHPTWLPSPWWYRSDFEKLTSFWDFICFNSFVFSVKELLKQIQRKVMLLMAMFTSLVICNAHFADWCSSEGVCVCRG